MRASVAILRKKLVPLPKIDRENRGARCTTLDITSP